MSFINRFKFMDENGNPINHDNPFPVILKYFYRLIWKSKIDFNKGNFTDTEVSEDYDEAKLQLTENSDNSNNIPFTTPGNYTYDSAKITVEGGLAKLKSSVTSENNWTFGESGDPYTYNSDKIEIIFPSGSDGIARLKGTPVQPYAHWHLNESSGTNVSDSSGNGRNGTTQNMEDSDWVTGKLNNGLQFDGTNEYVNCGDIADFERTDSFSLEVWINNSNTSNDIMTRYSGGKGWILYLASSGKIYFTLRNSAGTNEASRYSSGIVNTGTWKHVIVTYDGSSSNSGIKIYIDGNEDTDATSGVDTLTSSISVSANMILGGRTGSASFNGKMDEVVIYDKELSSDEVTTRYNSGTGTESMPGAYSTDNPSIVTDNGFVFTSNITEFLETTTTPSGTEIKYHLSSDNGSTWKYWNGSSWAITDGSYSQANTASEINENIFDLASSGTLKIRALLHTDDELETPELDNIYIAVATYPVGSWEISMNWDIQPSHNFGYVSATEIVSKPSGTNIKYQYSTNSGSSYNGSWLTESELETALQGISCVGDGSDKIRLKFQLTTNSTIKSPNIDNLNIISDAGYNVLGEYESNVYDSLNSSLEWGIVDFNIETPSGTSLIIRVRASNNTSDMGAYGSGLVNGQESNIVGRYIQWKAEFTGNGAKSPKIDDFAINYSYPTVREVNP